MALARYRGVAQDAAGNVIPNATVEVRRDQAGRPVVPLFSDRNGTVPLGNPITANSLGQFGFHAPGGVYYIRVYTGTSQAPLQEFIDRYVAIGTAAERDVEELASSLNSGIGVFATFEGLELFTPEAGNVGARVINDPNPALNGDYIFVEDEWVKQRPLPDTLARMEATGGTADAIEATISVGIDPAAVVMMLLTPDAANTGPVTLNGIDLLAFDGAPLEAGWLEPGVPVFLFVNDDGDYQLTSDLRYQTLAAQALASRNQAVASEAKAEQWADNAEDVAVEAGQFSAKHHANKAAASAGTASADAATASTAAGTATGASANAIEAKEAAEALYGDLSAVAQAKIDAVAAAEASGDRLHFDTKALASAALSGLNDLQVVEVFNDESLGGARTLYRVETGALVFKTIAGISVEDEFTPSFAGAVPATVRSMLEREVWADYSFGADGTEAGDIAGVQAAIDYVGSQGGGTVRFLAREYLGGGWTWPNGVRLIGSGSRRSAGSAPKGTVIQRTVASPVFAAEGVSMLVGGPMDDSLAIKDMLIHGGDLGPDLVTLRAATHFRMDGVFLKNVGEGSNLVLYEVFDSRINDSAFESGGNESGTIPMLLLKNTYPSSDLTNQIQISSSRFETFPGTAIKGEGNDNNEIYFSNVKVECMDSIRPLVDLEHFTAVHFGLLQIASHGGLGASAVPEVSMPTAFRLETVMSASGTIHMEHFGASSASDLETYATLDSVFDADLSFIIYGSVEPTSGSLVTVLNSTESRNDIRVWSNIPGSAPVRTLSRRGSALVSAMSGPPSLVFKREDIPGESWTEGSVVADGAGSRYRILHNETPVFQIANDHRIAADTGQFIIAGTWQKPLVMAGKYFWCDPATNKLYVRSGLPTSATDGTVVGTQTA